MKLGHGVVCFVLCLLLSGRAADKPTAPAAATIRAEDVVAHLEQTIAWYRSVNTVERSPVLAHDVLPRDTARRLSTEVLRLAFDFARAQATVLQVDQSNIGAESVSRQGTPGRDTEHDAARAAEKVASLQARLKNLDAAVAKASRRSLPILVARRNQVLAELNLAQQIQKIVKSVVAFTAAAEPGKGGLASRIDKLERSVPGAKRSPQQPSQTSPAAMPTTDNAVPHPESAGVIGLSTELFTLARTRTHMKHVLDETDALLKGIGQLRAPLVSEASSSIRRSDTIGASGSEDLEQLAAGRREIEKLTDRFKQMSAVFIPLREEGILVGASRDNLLEWLNTLEERYSTVAGSLLIRAAVLGVGICVVLILSYLWRRITFHYARDARRRRQFLILRRIVVSCAIAFLIASGFITGLGWLATYAGFLTAGLAFALQTPIMSVVAYFFLIGRYGLRVGDRVTISGVTGDVIDIGLVRMQVVELAGKGASLHPTGRVVAFANGVLFQPAALFKHMPGTDYVWHTVTLTLAPECDARFAESKLMEAVNSVYEGYRDGIEKQHALFERSVDMKVSPPRPAGRVRFIDSGIEFSVQYPVEIQRASTIDERVMRALNETIEREPKLELSHSGEASIQETV